MILPLLLALQITPTPKLPPANPLPPPLSEESQVLAPIQRMFDGLAARDASAIQAQLRPDGGATVAIERPDGTRTVRHLSWTEFTSGIKPGPERHEERFVGQPAVEIDGDIAMVWGNYVFTIDGKVHHCGVDHFDLVRENGSWKVVNVTWTQRTSGCAQ